MKQNDPHYFPQEISDFSDPFSLLKACHQRTRNHCAALNQLAAEVAQGQLGLNAAAVALGSFRYFSGAAKRHQEDEEQSLYPRLVRQSLKIAEIIHHLKGQHQHLESLWSRIAPQLARINQVKEGAQLTEQLHQFTAAHLAHLEAEEGDLMPLAMHILSSRELKEIGSEMAQRRGRQ
ncbi:MAG: hemerythrin domain-containing protein [Gammaproteobacteria bacterium]|nr:hemerythrin domain-containing protein [Gammaproteobacteria bacterium]